MRSVRSRVRTILLGVAAACVLAAGALAATRPRANDLGTILNTIIGQQLAQARVQHNPEPPLVAAPDAKCGSGSHPDPEMQGRVSQQAISSGKAADGYWCNLTRIGHYGGSGGFKVFRYTDSQGHECAFYDTTLLFPTNVINLTSSSRGGAVLDMSDPAHPVQTASLTTPAMLSPHESLNLNAARGLLAADLGNPTTHPGWVDTYSVSGDCRHPVLQSSGLFAHFGHESGFSADGKTFWSTSASAPAVTAVDLSDPAHPGAVWVGNIYVHGMTLSEDGNRAYMADPVNHQLLILDTSQIQARVPNPQAREISRLTWNEATIPQNAIPIRIHGHPYVLEIDEYAGNATAGSDPKNVGAARIIDIGDETHPRVVSNLRLAVNQYANRDAIANDPGMVSVVQGYAAHYCNVPRENDPEIVACSFISSGLRVFDIRHPLHPKEIAYHIAPPSNKFHNYFSGANFAMSKPAFAPERREIWYSDGVSGFYVLRVDKSVWPAGLGMAGCTPAGGRLGGRSLGPVRLGRARAVVRRLFVRFSTRGRSNMDFYCLTGRKGVRGGGIRAGYPSGRLLRSLSPQARNRVRGRAILALTHNRRYSLRGVRPGAKLAAVAKRLHLGRGFKVGRNTWFIIPGRVANGVLKVNHGVVGEIGIADKQLTGNRAAIARFLTSFS